MPIRLQRLPWLLSGWILLATGCSTPQPPKTLAEHGPDVAVAVPGVSTGTLVVFTAPTTGADPVASPHRLIYSDYRLESAAGADLGVVKNHSDSVWEGPVEVTLPGGRYRIAARANGLGAVLVPVYVVEGRTTTVHLDVTSATRH